MANTFLSLYTYRYNMLVHTLFLLFLTFVIKKKTGSFATKTGILQAQGEDKNQQGQCNLCTPRYFQCILLFWTSKKSKLVVSKSAGLRPGKMVALAFWNEGNCFRLITLTAWDFVEPWGKIDDLKDLPDIILCKINLLFLFPILSPRQPMVLSISRKCRW